MKYVEDKEFTDRVHVYALEHIYRNLGWQEEVVDEQKISEWIDVNAGVDRIFKNTENRRIYVQERFRDKNYAGYNDFTLRYMREENPHEDRKLSEFFKIRADYLVYGVIDRSKAEVMQDQNVPVGFIKYVVVNLQTLFCLINLGYIKISKEVNECAYENGVLRCPVKYNRDGSSSFVVFDVEMLYRLAHDRNISIKTLVLRQHGYDVPEFTL